jgi:hypothetical protein
MAWSFCPDAAWPAKRKVLLQSGALFTKYKSTEFVAQPRLFRIACLQEVVGEFEKCLLFLRTCLDPCSINSTRTWLSLRRRFLAFGRRPWRLRN